MRLNFLKKWRASNNNDAELNSDPIEQNTPLGDDEFDNFEPEHQENNNDDDVIEQMEKKWQKKREKMVLGSISNTRLISVMVGVFVLYQIFYSGSIFRICVDTQKEINECGAEIERLNYQIKQDCVIIYGIENDRTFLIKYARENLYLSDKEEDIYIIDEL